MDEGMRGCSESIVWHRGILWRHVSKTKSDFLIGDRFLVVEGNTGERFRDIVLGGHDT